MNGGVERSWEVTKENIQPLPTGRRMAYLEESLPVRGASGFNDQHQYEEYHMNEIKKLEKIAEKNEGTDPLQSWVDIIKYIEQHFPTMNPTVHSTYQKLNRKVVQMYYHDERYANDRRYANFYIKAVEQAPPDRRNKMLLDFLDKGCCTKVCDIYSYLAEKYDKEGDTKKAVEILKRGVENDAQPKQLLQEMLTCIQDHWAERVAKQMQDGVSALETSGRNFASSVPVVGESNEPVSIRQNLPLAPPANLSKPKSGSNNPLRTGAIYQEGSSSEDVENNPSTKTRHNGRHQAPIDFTDRDRENRLDPSRWNTEHNHLKNPAIPEPPEKFQLYTEPDVNPRISKMGPPPPPVNKNVLQERKVERDDTDIPTAPANNESLLSSSASNNNAKDDKEIKNMVRERQEVKTRLAAAARGLDNKLDYTQFNENIKYKEVNRLLNRIMMKEAQFWEDQEKQLKDLTDTQLLRTEVNRLREENECLKQKSEEREKLSELKLQQKDEKIKSLEAHSEDLMSKLTKTTTENNLRETLFHRERSALQQEIEKLHGELANQKQVHEEQLSLMQSEVEMLRQQLMTLQASLKIKSKEGESSKSSPKKFTADSINMTMDISSAGANRSCENMLSSERISEGSAETSKFGSGETTVASNSFMPVIDNSLNMSKSISMSQNHLQPNRKLAMVERHDVDMMNITPAAPPTDFDLLPPPTFGFGGFKKKSTQPLKLYESISDSFAQPKSVKSGSFVSGKQTVEINVLKELPENRPPKLPIFSDENAPPSQVLSKQMHQNDSEAPFEPDPAYVASLKDAENFVKPELPVGRRNVPSISDENASVSGTAVASTDEARDKKFDLQKRISILSKRPLTSKEENSDEDEEVEVILRRHQQTGLDLNMSNLTTVLSLAPKPLINSTPEREKTLREIRTVPFMDKHEAEEVTQDYQGNNQPIPRYTSILSDPPLNLSTIQETSRENRSRSTTGSSSGGITMSTTRFGMAASTTQGHISRSSSVPRSGSRTSNNNTHFGYNSGYYSDTNAK